MNEGKKLVNNYENLSLEDKRLVDDSITNEKIMRAEYISKKAKHIKMTNNGIQKEVKIENIIQILKKEYKIIVLDKKKGTITVSNIEGLINYQAKDLDIYTTSYLSMRITIVAIAPKDKGLDTFYEIIDKINDDIKESERIENKKIKPFKKYRNVFYYLLLTGFVLCLYLISS